MLNVLTRAVQAQMLKKAKKTRRGGVASQSTSRAPDYAGPLGVPSLAETSAGKTTPETIGDSDEEADAFL